MSEELFKHALEVFEDQARCRIPPRLALLGPPGSGKSNFLNSLMNSFNSREGPFTETRSLMLDLRNVPIGSQLEIYFYINQALLQEAARIGINKDFDIKVQMSHLRFEEILRELLGAVKGHLVIFIDHLESVPRLFASDLSHRFRSFLETTEYGSDYLRLGFIVAGAISLFDLKHGPDSAFQMMPVLRFPRRDEITRIQLVEEYVKKNYGSTEISADLLNLLAELTGGEPGFLEPLIVDLLNEKQVPLSEELISAAVQQVCIHSQNQVLRNLALHLWSDEGLQEVVRDLAQALRVMPRAAAFDLDRYELSGAVVLGGELSGEAREYKFRNGVTRFFLTELSNSLAAGDCVPRPQTISVEKELRKLDTARKQCLTASKIWPWLYAVRDAWLAITPYNQPKLYLYVTKLGTSSGWWLDADTGKIGDEELRQSSDLSTKSTTFSALDQVSLALSGDTDTIKAFIESDSEHISIAMPLYARDIVFIITATLSRSDAGRGLTEFDLCHWLRFVQNVKHVVPNLVLAELCENILEEREVEESQSSAAVERLKTKRIYLLSDGDAIVDEASRVSHISGRISNVEHMNRRFLGLIDQSTDHRQFQSGVQGIAIDLETALEARFRELKAALTPDSVSQLVIASDAEGLKIPFELFPHANSYLALLTGVSRQIIGRQLRADLCFTFDELLRSLVRQKRELRVLLVASYVDKPPTASDELKNVRQHIARGCSSINLRTRFVELLADEATVERVEQELMDNGPYHIFHYSGHGRHFSEDPDASGIVLRVENGGTEVVKCKKLRRWFTAAQSWLAYLSCCNSSASSGSAHDLSARYVGMIDALVAAGVPNVIGFRCLVSDEAALHLANQFYRQLFTVQREKNLSLAMLAARQKVDSRSECFDAWASSMLITQYL